MTKKELAVQEFRKGYNCAQSVLLAFAQELGLERKLVENLAGGMGGGMRIGEICGAVSGAVMVLGMKRGFDLDTKWALYEIVTEFMQRFEEAKGSTVCKTLLGYDFSIPEQQKQAVTSGRTKELCPKLVESAVELLETLLDKLG